MTPIDLSKITERTIPISKYIEGIAYSFKEAILNLKKTGVNVRVFGGLKKDALNPNEKWKVPPSPPEVKTFNIEKIPYIIIFTKKGELIGKIIENPKYKEKLEEEILYLIEKYKGFISQFT